MSQINFVFEFRAIMETCRKECVPGLARLLWVALFYLANDRARLNEETDTYEWPDDFFPVNNAEVNTYCPIEKRALLEARNRLKQLGVIDFRPGESQHKPAKYKVIYLTGSGNGGRRYKNAPPDVPPHAPPDVPPHAPPSAPRNVPIYTINSKDTGISETQKDIHTHNDQYRHPDARARLKERYLDARGREQACRFDGAFLTSDRARASVAQRILDQFCGDVDVNNAHYRLCEWLHDGMPPEIMEDEIGDYTCLSEFMGAMAGIFCSRRYEERRDQLEMNRCLRASKGNMTMAKFLYKCSDRYHEEEG